MAQIFAMGAVGFWLVRRGFVDATGLKLLSWLSINVAFPFFIFNQLINHFDPLAQSHWWAYPLINIGLGLTGFLVAAACAILLRCKQPREWVAVSALHNAGYIPLLFITMLPAGEPQVIYPYMILSIVGFDLCLWSLGAWLIAYRTKAVINWRNFINPPLVAMTIAFIMVLLGLKGFLPDIVLKPIKVIGDSALAMAMLTIGGNLALTSFDQLKWKEVSGAVLIKLIVLPVLALVFLCLVPVDPIFAFILIIQACMPTSITLSVIARNNDNTRQDFINQAIFISHVLCAVTIPLFLGLYGKLIH